MQGGFTNIFSQRLLNQLRQQRITHCQRAETVLLPSGEEASQRRMQARVPQQNLREDLLHGIFLRRDCNVLDDQRAMLFC